MKQSEVIKHIQQYANTGIIHDALIPFYDQHGEWKGDTIAWKTPIPHELLQSICHSRLPTARRYLKSHGGTVLLTSWYVYTKADCRIRHPEVRGSIIAHENWPLHAPGLRTVGGHVCAPTKHRIYLPYLHSVGGHFDTASSFRLYAPRLRSVGSRMKIAADLPPILEYVGGNLSTFWEFHIHAPKLRRIGGHYVPHKAESISVPLLESIGGGFLLGDMIRIIKAPLLKSIGGDFWAERATEIRAPLLRTVGGNMDTRAAAQFYHPALRVGGGWACNPQAIHSWIIRQKTLQALRHHGELPEL